MAGHAGSGKSTLARSIAARLGGLVLDLDTIKSALLESGVDWAKASSGSYEVIYGLVNDLLPIPQAVVIVDTPSYWLEIHERLTAAADAFDATYRFVECVAEEEVRATRLSERPTRRSQIRELGINSVDATPDTDAVHLRSIRRPENRMCLQVACNIEVDLDQLITELGRAS